VRTEESGTSPEVVCDWRRQPDVRPVETERPDVVIQELAERFLMGPP
jgi:hypothetical protein